MTERQERGERERVIVTVTSDIRSRSSAVSQSERLFVSGVSGTFERAKSNCVL